jgi:hypothetical protein
MTGFVLTVIGVLISLWIALWIFIGVVYVLATISDCCEGVIRVLKGRG